MARLDSMKWILGLLVVFFSASMSVAQMDNTLSFGGGYSRHGTDDVGGFFFSINYEKKLREKIGASFSIIGTIHDGRTPVLYYDEIELVWKTGNLLFVTGGVHLSTGLTYRLVSLKKGNIALGLAPLLRYQTTSNPDYSLANFYSTNYFSDSNFKRSFSVGGVGCLAYTINLKGDFFISISSSLQYDTHEDALGMVGFSIGRRITRQKDESD